MVKAMVSVGEDSEERKEKQRKVDARKNETYVRAQSLLNENICHHPILSSHALSKERQSKLLAHFAMRSISPDQVATLEGLDVLFITILADMGELYDNMIVKLLE
jgi:hypothetical protein